MLEELYARWRLCDTIRDILVKGGLSYEAARTVSELVQAAGQPGISDEIRGEDVARLYAVIAEEMAADGTL